MAKFTALIEILGTDYPYVKDALEGSQFKLMIKEDKLFALTYGDRKSKFNIVTELESELASLGIQCVETHLYFELRRAG